VVQCCSAPPGLETGENDTRNKTFVKRQQTRIAVVTICFGDNMD